MKTAEPCNSALQDIQNSPDVEYFYTGLYLTEIDTCSTDYYISYDKYGNKTLISLDRDGNTKLADYVNNQNNGKLTQINYSNGQKVKYIYDTLERVSEIQYNSNGSNTFTTAYKYTYDANGNLYKTEDYIGNTETYCRYDHNGKLSEYITASPSGITGTNSSRSGYTVFYDNEGRVSTISGLNSGTRMLYLSSNDSEQSSGSGVLLTNENGYSMWCPNADYPELTTFYNKKLRFMRFNMIAETISDTCYSQTTFTNSQMSSLQSQEVPNILAVYALRFMYSYYFQPEGSEINFDEQLITPIGTFHFPDNYVSYEVSVEFVHDVGHNVQGIICLTHYTGKPFNVYKEDHRAYYAFDEYPEAEYFYNMLLTYISAGTEDAKMFFDT